MKTLKYCSFGRREQSNPHVKRSINYFIAHAYNTGIFSDWRFVSEPDLFKVQQHSLGGGGGGGGGSCPLVPI